MFKMVAEVMANRIYFAQHGLAVRKEEDSSRPLSATGIKQTTDIAEQLRISKIQISDVYHSGKLRAQQTAEIFASSLKVPSILTSDYLSPNDDVEMLAENLNINNALYVGHLPHLEKLICYLVTKHKIPEVLNFRNSAVVCLEKNDNAYTIDGI